MSDGGTDKGRRRRQEREGGWGEWQVGSVRGKKGGLELRTEKECQTRRDGGRGREGGREG